jgi:hypothetical protein
MCQDCALNIIISNDNTYNDGIKCPQCSMSTHNTVIRPINALNPETKTYPSPIPAIKHMELDLVKSAWRHFKGERAFVADQSLRELLNDFFAENASLKKYCQGYKNMTIRQLNLLVSRLEAARQKNYQIHGNALPLGPLERIHFKHNVWFERIMDIRSFKIPSTCLICYKLIDNNATLFECECPFVQCIDCTRLSCSNRENTYRSGFACHCSTESNYLLGVEDAIAYEDELVASVSNAYPKRRSAKKSDPREKELLLQCMKYGFVLDNTNHIRRNDLEIFSDAAIRLELARIECLRRLLREKFSYTNNTPAQEIQQKLREFNLLGSYLPLGPLDRVIVPKNAFLNLAIRLSRTAASPTRNYDDDDDSGSGGVGLHAVGSYDSDDVVDMTMNYDNSDDRGSVDMPDIKFLSPSHIVKLEASSSSSAAAGRSIIGNISFGLGQSVSSSSLSSSSVPALAIPRQIRSSVITLEPDLSEYDHHIDNNDRLRFLTDYLILDEQQVHTYITAKRYSC